MKKYQIGAVVIILITVCTTLPITGAQQEYLQTFQLPDYPGGRVTHRLFVYASEQLVSYFNQLNADTRMIYSTNDFQKYITPYPVQPIADKLKELYADKEDYVNGVLMMVHQLNYTEMIPEKYPVETIFDGYGDCDVFSLLAASILQASGDFEIVLLFYEINDTNGTQYHMNIGVHMDTTPQDTRKEISSTPYYIMYENDKYYIAECTGNSQDWISGWRLGEIPVNFKDLNATIIPVLNQTQISPGKVTASYNTLATSELTIKSTQMLSIQNSVISINGQIDPKLQNQEITIYAKSLSSDWQEIGQVITTIDGSFTYSWNCSLSGLCSIQASWSGTTNYASATSMITYLLILPKNLVVTAGLVLVAIIIGAVIYTSKRRNNTQVPDYSSSSVSNINSF